MKSTSILNLLARLKQFSTSFVIRQLVLVILAVVHVDVNAGALWHVRLQQLR